jgi:uncharacterized protein (TIGR03067 family)
VPSLIAGPLLLLTSLADINDYSRLQGVWSFVSVEVDGAEQPTASFEGHRLIILEDGRYTIVQGPRITTGRVTLDPTRTPKHYDVTITDGPRRDQVTPGIYDFSGDTFRICLALPGRDRPSTFDTQPGSGRIAFSFWRIEKDPKPNLVALARQQMAGTWRAVAYSLRGEPPSAEDLKKVKLTIDPTGLAIASSDGQVFIAGTTSIDPTTHPMRIDITFTEGDAKGGTALGIYKIEDDILTIRRAAPGQSRPSDFASPPGSGVTLMTYKRETP